MQAQGPPRGPRLQRPLRLPARRLPAPRLPRDRGRAAACWSRRPPAPARRWWGSSPSTWRSRPAASASTRRRSRRCRNQKYHDLVDRYGADEVGLLTGDNVVNGEAPVVVMTTEVLRNMLYAGVATLLGLGFVVMDEVHYLADRSRGAVWEEVIIHLPESVTVVSLSRDGVQRRGVRRVAGDRPRRDHDDRRGAPAGPALPARDGRQAAARPVRVLRRRRGGRLRQGGRPGQRRADEDRPRRLGQHPPDARPALAPQGQAGVLEAKFSKDGRTSATAAGSGSPAGPTSSTGSTARGCCRRSCSSSAGSAATPRSSSASTPACG